MTSKLFFLLVNCKFTVRGVLKTTITTQKMKFSKCDQIRSFLLIWSHLLKKSLLKNFNFCAVYNGTICENS